MIHISPRIALRRDLAIGGFALAFVASLLTALISAPLAAQPAHKQGTPIFKIGEFNRSSIELAQGDPKQKIDYVVGQSTAAKDWYSNQRVVFKPADENEVGAAPRTISFTVEHPAASYDFHLAVLIKGTSVPAVEVGINGKQGRFYLHPKLDYENGDSTDSFDPAYSAADVEFSFPGSLLDAGANTMTLEAVEDADEPIPGARITYDALELDSSTAAAARAVTAQLEPTIFFHEQNGVLCERVDAFIRSGRRVGAGGSADLVIAGKQDREALKGGYDFGEERVEFLVPEFSAQTEAQLRLAAPASTSNSSKPSIRRRSGRCGLCRTSTWTWATPTTRPRSPRSRRAPSTKRWR